MRMSVEKPSCMSPLPNGVSVQKAVKTHPKNTRPSLMGLRLKSDTWSLGLKAFSGRYEDVRLPIPLRYRSLARSSVDRAWFDRKGVASDRSGQRFFGSLRGDFILDGGVQ